MVHKLQQLNNRFYRENAASFSSTRQAAWPGWERVAAHLAPGKLLDVACGNLRFERFLEGRFGAGSFAFTCIDSCVELIEAGNSVDFVEADVLDAIRGGRPLPTGFDAAVSFGFMHHVPTERLRVEFVRTLLESVGDGGLVALSFWCFMEDERLAKKAAASTEQGCRELGLQVEEGDYLLGWNDVQGAYRYCHSFTDAEVDALLEQTADLGTPLDRFNADGRSGALNRYTIIRRR